MTLILGAVSAPVGAEQHKHQDDDENPSVQDQTARPSGGDRKARLRTHSLEGLQPPLEKILVLVPQHLPVVETYLIAGTSRVMSQGSFLVQ